MKKAMLSIIINVSDNFECGSCSMCPLCSTSIFDNTMVVQSNTECKIGFQKFNCPIIVDKE